MYILYIYIYTFIVCDTNKQIDFEDAPAPSEICIFRYITLQT